VKKFGGGGATGAAQGSNSMSISRSRAKDLKSHALLKCRGNIFLPRDAL